MVHVPTQQTEKSLECMYLTQKMTLILQTSSTGDQRVKMSEMVHLIMLLYIVGEIVEITGQVKKVMKEL